MSSAPVGARLATRQAYGLVLGSALVPGAAHYVTGRRSLGRVALGVWLLVWVALAALGLGLLFFRPATVGILLRPAVAGTLRVLAWLVFVGWLALLLDAWRLGFSREVPRRSRLGLTGLVLALSLVAGSLTGVVSSAFVAAQNVGEVFTGGGDREQNAGRYNILLLGADAAATREGLRPDSINVASVDAATGRTVIFGLPRNLQRVPFPAGHPLRKLYPHGYHCADRPCMLNEVWTEAEDHRELFPDSGNPGLETTRQVVEEVLGLELNYYALVDMGGFRSLVDAMGGIRIDNNVPVPIGGGSSPVRGHIQPGRGIHLDGYHALWYARSREGSNDYQRMVRQKCVMAAMAKQLDPMTVATRFVELSEAGKDILHTDVGPDQVAELADLALKGRSLDLVTVNMAPPLVPSTANPDFNLIRQTVRDTIAAAEAADEDRPAPATSGPTAPATSPAPATPKASPTPSAAPTTSAPAVPVETDGDGEPAWICRVSS